MSETPADEHLLDGHDDAEPHHPDNIHDPHREYHRHHRPAATKTITTLFDAEVEHTTPCGGPIGKKEWKRMLASVEARMLQRRELIGAGPNKDRAREQAARHSNVCIK